MNKFLKTADKIIFIIVDNISSLMTFFIFAIITFMVIIRFTFKTSSFGFEELPTYFLMIAIWFGAVICSRNPQEGQIRIDLFVGRIKNKLVQVIIQIVVSCISVSCIALFAYLMLKYVVFCFNTGQTTLALNFPMWILTGLTFLASAFLALYEIVILVKDIMRAKEIIEGRKAA